MKNKLLIRICSCVLIAAVAAATVPAQKPAPKPVTKPVRTIMFAVLDDGTNIEPIGYLNRGKLEATVDGGDAGAAIAAFARTYYKPGASYRLIFGGANAGSVSVKKSNEKADCAPNTAQATTKTTKAPLKGLVMGLATNAVSKSTAASFRRKPTAAEKDEIDALAKAEFVRQKLTPKVLRFQNLTALDFENDGTPEFVGSYWVEVDRQTRALLFFIASKVLTENTH